MNVLSEAYIYIHTHTRNGELARGQSVYLNNIRFILF